LIKMIDRRAFIIGIKSTKLSIKEIKFIKKYKPWGIILFSRNINSIRQTFELTSKIRKIFKDNKYPILVDQEGGRVNRFKNIISFEHFTSKFFGNLYKKNFKEFQIIHQLFVEKISFLLKETGININTYPVLDLNVKGSSKIIGNRSFSHDPDLISKIGDLFIKSFHQNNIATVIKHIPGHGHAKVDSHDYTPIIDKKKSFLLKKDFKAFKNKKSFFAMTAHIIFSNIDKKNTVTHSKKLIKLIRNDIGFKNILISDDLSMKSLKGSLRKITTDTFKSGCNLALHCNANYKEMLIIGKNSPLLSDFIIKKTSQFYKFLR
tara:strand:- start:1743 stop:2699 length:957 start_codon:yes stop_codon:yes gene_type:complete